MAILSGVNNGALIRGSKGKNRRALLVQPGRHTTRRRILRNPLEAEEAATADDRRVDLRISIPAIDTAMRIKNSGKQFVHVNVLGSCSIPRGFLPQEVGHGR